VLLRKGENPFRFVIRDVERGVVAGRADWADILDRWAVDLVAIEAGNDALRPFIEADAGWQLRFEDEDGALFGRSSSS